MFKAFSQYFPFRLVFLPVTENLLLWGALLLAVRLQYYGNQLSLQQLLNSPTFRAEAFIIILLCQLCFYWNDLYDLSAVNKTSERWIRRSQALGGWCLILFAGYLFYPGLLPRHGVLTTTVILALVALPLWREIVNWMGLVFENRHRVLFLGTGQVGIDLCAKLRRRNDLNFDVVGFLSDRPEEFDAGILGSTVIGKIDSLVDTVKRHRVDRVVISLADRRGTLPVKELLRLRLQGIEVQDAHTLYEHVAGRISLDSVHPSWMIFSEGFRKFRWQLFLKRCFDVVLASLGLVLTAPMMLLVAIAIRLDSKGSVLFRQERVGQFGLPFELFKFRSMSIEAEAHGGPRWATANDSRITRVGRFLRRSRLDELPQFFNILRGDMSLVGPRPERPFFVEQLEKKLKYYQDRHVVKPGLTGWAQINFSYASSEEETREKLEYDFFYIKNFSVLFDLLILFKTVKIVLLGEGAR